MKNENHNKKLIYTGLDKAKPANYLEAYNNGGLSTLSEEKKICELQLANIESFIPLNIFFDPAKIMQDVLPFEDNWNFYMSSDQGKNQRFGLPLLHYKSDLCDREISIQDSKKQTNRALLSKDFPFPTAVLDNSLEIQRLINYFSPVFRSYLLKLNRGGYFPPHRDQLWLGRDTFRLIGFVNKCHEDDFVWIHGGVRQKTSEGRLYFVNTRIKHQTFSYSDNCIHLVLNCEMSLNNVLRLLSYI